jgi:hypothetical protein
MAVRRPTPVHSEGSRRGRGGRCNGWGGRGLGQYNNSDIECINAGLATGSANTANAYNAGVVAGRRATLW